MKEVPAWAADIVRDLFADGRYRREDVAGALVDAKLAGAREAMDKLGAILRREPEIIGENPCKCELCQRAVDEAVGKGWECELCGCDTAPWAFKVEGIIQRRDAAGKAYDDWAIVHGKKLVCPLCEIDEERIFDRLEALFRALNEYKEKPPEGVSEGVQPGPG